MIRKSIPSVLTSMNIVCGFLSLLVEPKIAIALILIGGIFDVFDGAVARLLNAQSELGKQLDSLADIVTFGVAPAFLLTHFLESPYSYFLCLIPVFGGVRLARFNISGDETYWFSGMPIPATAMTLVGIAIAVLGGLQIPTLLLLSLAILVGLLNVASFLAMFSLKGIKKDKYAAPFLGLCILVGLIMSFINLPMALISSMIAYLLLSILYTLLVKRTS